MIFDTLANIENYKGLGKVYDALKFLKNADFSSCEKGRHDIDGDNIYYIMQEYETKTDAKYAEAHKKYIDIQLMVEGVENIGYSPIEAEKTVYEENPEADYALYSCEMQKLKLVEDSFMIFYPNDLHMPGCAIDKPSKVRKVVAKVIVE